MDMIEGRLLSVAETWPLQLSVQPASGPAWAVTLAEDVQVRAGGRPAKAGALRPGQQLRVQGPALGPQALLGQQVEML